MVSFASPDLTKLRSSWPPLTDLLVLVDPDLLGVDGGVHLGLDPFQLQDTVLLAVATRTKAPPTKCQLVLNMLLQCDQPAAS